MPGYECIRYMFIWFWKAGKAAVLAQGAHLLTASGEYFMGITLVPYIKYKTVNFKIIYAMERNRQLMDEAIRYGKDFYRNR